MVLFENATSITETLTIANTLSDGLLVYSFIVTMFCVLFFSTVSFGRSRALQFSSLITGLLMLILNNMGLVPWWFLVGDMVIFGIATFMLQQKKNEYTG